MKHKNEENLISRNKMSYFIVSFVQGISSLADLAIQYFLKDYLKLEPYEMSRVLAIVMIPWIIKPLLGLLTDLVPIFGYRRKMYLILCGQLGFFSWLLMSMYADNLTYTIILLILVNFSFSFASIIGEALVVELSQLGEILSEYEEANKSHVYENNFSFEKKSTSSEKAKHHVSMFFIFKNVGALLSSFFRGYLLEIMSIRSIFLLNAFVALFILIAGLILIERQIAIPKRNTIGKEEELKKWDEDHIAINKYHDYFSITTSFDEKREHLLQLHREQIKAESRKVSAEFEINKSQLVKKFFLFISKKEVFIPAIFSTLLFSTPNFADPFFYYMTNYLKFSPGQLGVLSLMTSIGILIAIFSYRYYFKTCSFKSIVSISTLLYFLFTFIAYLLVLRVNVYYNIPDFVVCMFGFIFLSVVGEMSMMPILTLACTMCPKNLEATVYSFFMSSINLGQALSTLNSSFVTSFMHVTARNFDNLGLLIILCNFIKIMPIIILFFISTKYFEGRRREEEYFLLKEEHEELIEAVNPKENIKKILI